ncbi:MAG TPA: hypothetical protein VNT79_11445 [Phycisphaerae bacterium]|nr:hypothetical protein [Phycisphaerae bacterium]
MAVNTSQTSAEMGGRRLAIGANVTLSILIAVALVAAINWIASLRYVRKDMATIGNYGISERTRRILSGASEAKATTQPAEKVTNDNIHISVVYAPNSKDEKQQEYIDRLLEYCDELRASSNKVVVKHIATAREREELAAEINKTFGGEADQHRKALESFEGLRTQLMAALQQISTQSDALLQAESWLSDFPLFTQINLKLREMQKQLDEAAEEIKNQTGEAGIAKYGEATTRAKTAVETIKQTLEVIGKLTGELTKLADEVTKPDSPNIKMLREVAASAKSEIDSLRQTVGNENDPPPADVKGALKAYADRGVQLGATLDSLVQRVDDFAKQFPIVRQHASWTTRVQSGPLMMQLEVADVLDDMGRSLGETRLQLLGIIDTGDAEKLSQALKSTRQNTTRMEKNAAVCERLLTELADRLSNLDEGSKALLEASRDNGLFKNEVQTVAQVETTLKDLPELKMGSVVDKLNEDNSLVIKYGDKIRVVDFGTVWPVRENMAGGESDKEEEVRTFNGDSAISSAILSLTAAEPFAAVTIVSFEPEAPQQRSPFMPPPPQSSVPAADLTEAKSRLEAANFKVYDWNLATTKERPEIQSGLKDILILLPPAPPAPPNPFAGQQPESPMFGDEQRTVIRGLIDNGARALFVGAWEVVPGGFMANRFTTPPYGYEPVLADWGLRLDNATRIVAVEPDVRTPNGFYVNVRKFGYMPLTDFTEHPVGKPMEGTRFLVENCARIEKLADAPTGVKTEVVATVAKKEDYIGASIDEIIQIINRINDRGSDGLIQLDHPPMRDRFDVMMTATREGADQKAATSIAVMAFGQSIGDHFVKRPILADAERARFAPEPKESLDLLVNSIYWLNDTEGYIGRGPSPVPRVRSLSDNERRFTRAFVWLGWPAIVVAPGIFLWFARRR